MEFYHEELSPAKASSLETICPTGIILNSVNTSACENDILAESPLRYRNDRNKLTKLIFKQSRDMDRQLNGLITKNTSKFRYSQCYREPDKQTDKEDLDDSDRCYNEDIHMKPVGFSAYEQRLSTSPLGFMKSGKLSIDIHLGSESKYPADSSADNIFKIKSSAKYFMRSRYTPLSLSTDCKWTDSIYKQEATEFKPYIWNEDCTVHRNTVKRQTRSISVNKPKFPAAIGVSKPNSSVHCKRKLNRYVPKFTQDHFNSEILSAIEKSKQKSSNNPWKLSQNKIEGKAIFDAMEIVSKCNSYKLNGFRYNNKC